MTPQEVIEKNITEALPIPYEAVVWSPISGNWYDKDGKGIIA